MGGKRFRMVVFPVSRMGESLSFAAAGFPHQKLTLAFDGYQDFHLQSGKRGLVILGSVKNGDCRGSLRQDATGCHNHYDRLLGKNTSNSAEW